MFDLDKWQEIMSTLRKNKLRTFLTGFSVAWGIMMLIILLAAGQGLRNGISSQFLNGATNSFSIRSGNTSLPYKGLNSNRQIRLMNSDYDYFSRNLKDIESIAGRFNIWSSTMEFQGEQANYRVRAVHPHHAGITLTQLSSGRFINESDIVQKRKVVCLGKTIIDELYKGQDPIGTFISIQGISFLVVGTYIDESNQQEERYGYVPINVGQQVFGRGFERISQLLVAYDQDFSDEQVSNLEDEIRTHLAETKIYDINDSRAMFVRNIREDMQRVLSVIDGVEAFIWLIGIFTIIAGIVGVANIMMVVVKERTQEIGVRKALGATPNSIIGLVLQESITITLLAGYIGLLLGVGIVELAGSNINSDFFRQPEVDFQIALITLLVLVVAGALAGFFPARKAAKIKPIEALRDE